ncbi:hypothetical protein ACLOJK_024455 [Asimina triloba]
MMWVTFSSAVLLVLGSSKLLGCYRNLLAPDRESEMDVPKEIFLKDYKKPDYYFDTVDLKFELAEDKTLVFSKIAVVPRVEAGISNALTLDGSDLKLLSIKVNGDELKKEDFHLTSRSLSLPSPPSGTFTLEIITEIYPQNNTSLEGLYKTSGIFCTQCEAEGFRRITYYQPNALPLPLIPTNVSHVCGISSHSFSWSIKWIGLTWFSVCDSGAFMLAHLDEQLELCNCLGHVCHADRPDVMAKYTCRIEADKTLYPVLLSNGNLIEQGDLEAGKHYAVWEDPFKKPCYLFALVAGQLESRDDNFVTYSGRNVSLRIWSPAQDLPKTAHAMYSLKAAMKWDEEVFGLEYDLDLFNIVSVPDFNMGAMENKSLNIFNSKLILASPETATDADYAVILGVIGHEYFHNWTGNRLFRILYTKPKTPGSLVLPRVVTCRDWFQLTLKEGLTVFRDQEFSSDMGSRTVKRIADVSKLRTYQFPQDASPMAHPVRPHSYIKGAEVVRMYKTLLSLSGFRKGMDLYFQRHDGQAVTCEDFFAAMRDANDADFSNFLLWYSQAGTPHVNVTTSYDPEARTYTLKFREAGKNFREGEGVNGTESQGIPPTPGQPVKEPMFIPVAVGLLDSDGNDMPLTSVYQDGVLQRITRNGQHVFTTLLQVTKLSKYYVRDSDTWELPYNALSEVKKKNKKKLKRKNIPLVPHIIKHFNYVFSFQGELLFIMHLFNSCFDTEQKEQEFVFSDISERPIPSLLRGYSAPIRLDSDLCDSDLFFLLAHDSDEFNRSDVVKEADAKPCSRFPAAEAIGFEPKVCGGTQKHTSGHQSSLLIFVVASHSQEFVAKAIALPGEGEIMDMMEVADPDAVHAVRSFIRKQLAIQLKSEFLSMVKSNRSSEQFVFDHPSMARRALKNIALAYVTLLEEAEIIELALHEYHSATNMTEQYAALAAISQTPGKVRDDVLSDFYNKWEHDFLVSALLANSGIPEKLHVAGKHEEFVVDKWFALQAMADIPQNVENVRKLLMHPAFDMRNPNKVYSLIGGFCGSRVNFHAKDGSGYKFLGEMVLQLDKINPQIVSLAGTAVDAKWLEKINAAEPKALYYANHILFGALQVASRLVSAFSRWKRYDNIRQALAKGRVHAQLGMIVSANGLSENVFEIASKSLDA